MEKNDVKKFEELNGMIRDFINITDRDRLAYFENEIERLVIPSSSKEDRIRDYYRLFIRSALNDQFGLKSRKIDLESFIPMLKVAISFDYHNLVVEAVQRIIFVMEKELEKLEEKSNQYKK